MDEEVLWVLSRIYRFLRRQKKTRTVKKLMKMIDEIIEDE